MRTKKNIHMGGSMGSQPQKTQGLQIFFLTRGFCRVFNADHFGKKKFLDRPIFFFMLWSKYCQNL
jgi:hypothetical protein